MADQSRQTPEPLALTNFEEGSNISSLLAVAGHNAEELAQRTIPGAMRETSIDEMWKLLDNTREEMHKLFPTLPPLKNADETSPETVYTGYLNSISDRVHDKLAEGAEKKIHFFDYHVFAAEDHPTGTTNRPDFLACRDDDKADQDEDKAVPNFHWSAVEATGELLSGKHRESSRIKTASYTSYLLQARPDRLTVQGINVDHQGFRLIVSNACGAFSTTLLDWQLPVHRLLLCAWTWRLYRPVVDPSITATIQEDNRSTFKIELPGNREVYDHCTILSVGSAFGRRTIVLQCPKPDRIIKEQYIETLRRFEEASILTQIHKGGTFPGVVRLDWHGSENEEELVVQWKDPKTGETSKRKKTRLVLSDKGVSIMNAMTLLEVLIAIYDVLELTRFLHTKRGVLHRDISINNVLLRTTSDNVLSPDAAAPPPNTSPADNAPLSDAVVTPANTLSGDNILFPDAAAPPPNTSPADNATLADAAPVNTSADAPPADALPVNTSFAKDLQEMCFASYLLKTKSNDQSVGRLDTNVLLIDFDMAGSQKGSDPNKKGPHSRTGTPIFMARSVVSATKMEGQYVLQPMPQLEPHQGHEIYEAAVPTRLEDFPPNKLELSEIPADKKLKPFKHKLQYDAESDFWLLFWWAIHALPALPADDPTGPTHTEIHPNHWRNLTGGDDKNDPRDAFFPRFPDNVLHPVYKPLERLLKDMSNQLWGYPEEGEDPSRKKDEYIHEALQRLIFRFMFTHYGERFMNVEKSRESRKPATVNAMKPPLTDDQKEKARAKSSAAIRTPDFSSSRSLRSDLRRKSPSTDEDHGDEDYKPSGPPWKRIHI